MKPHKPKLISSAFTLIELLIVIGVITLLLSISIPILSSSKQQGNLAVCGSNIRQLVLANLSYADDYNGSLVPAAIERFSSAGNKHRWFGIRDSIDKPFDPNRGPLSPYLSNIRLNCPARVNYEQLKADDGNYECGSGGYGYNMIYLGSQIWLLGFDDIACDKTAKISRIKRPAETLMFADTAMGRESSHYIEYASAEPYNYVVLGEIEQWTFSPSIHFRHRGRASIGWSDGHIGSEKMAHSDKTDRYGFKTSTQQLGWFEPLDNSMFDLE